MGLINLLIPPETSLKGLTGGKEVIVPLLYSGEGRRAFLLSWYHLRSLMPCDMSLYVPNDQKNLFDRWYWPDHGGQPARSFQSDFYQSCRTISSRSYGAFFAVLAYGHSTKRPLSVWPGNRYSSHQRFSVSICSGNQYL